MPRNVRTPLIGATLCAAALILLAIAASAIGPFEHLDRSLLAHVRRPDGSAAHEFFESVAQLGSLDPLLLGLAAVCVLGWRLGRGRQVYAALAVVAGANLSTQVLKQVLAHSRGIEFHGYEMPWADSFPSGHTTAAASLAMALILVAPRRYRGTAALVGASLAAAVGLAVVAIGWHFPSDVLGGLLVVATWGLAAVAVLRLDHRRRAEPVPAL